MSELPSGIFFDLPKEDKVSFRHAGINTAGQPVAEVFDRSIGPKPDAQIFRSLPKEVIEQEARFLTAREREAWRKVLGVGVEVKPLPDYITGDIVAKIQNAGMELRYIPALDLGNIEQLKEQGAEQYLIDLAKRYPTWERPESIDEWDGMNHSKNLNQSYWDAVKGGKTDFPKFDGYWVACEIAAEAGYTDEDLYTKISDVLGYGNRFSGITWDQARQRIDLKKEQVLHEVGLPSQLHIRMPELLEFNLLGNREVYWGSSESNFEWTNTAYNDGVSHVFQRYVGNGYVDGIASVESQMPNFDGDEDPMQFRILIPLPQTLK